MRLLVERSETVEVVVDDGLDDKAAVNEARLKANASQAVVTVRVSKVRDPEFGQPILDLMWAGNPDEEAR